jgi:hypothetical protein
MSWRASFKTAKTKNIGIYNDDGLLIASIDVHQLSQPEVVRAKMKTARMMAAAQELFDALCLAVKAMENSLPNGLTGDAKTAAFDAIAKATGSDQ